MKKLHWAGVLSLVLVFSLVISAGAPSLLSAFSNSSDPPAEKTSFESLDGLQFPAESSQFNGYSQSLETGKWPGFVRTGDLNNDSLVDLAVCSVDQNRVELYFQQADGEFSSTPDETISLGNAPGGMDIGDMNGDSLDDVVVSVTANDSVYIYCQDTDSSYYLWKTVPTNYPGPYEVVIDDFDNDSKNDFAVVRNSAGGVNCSLEVHFANYTNFNGGTYSLMAHSSYYATQISAGDFNDDNKPDIVIGDLKSDKVILLRNDISSYGVDNWTFVQSEDSLLPSEVSFVQMDATGGDELMIVSKDNNKVEIWEYPGSEPLVLDRRKQNLDQPVSATMTDLDDDGLKDLIVACKGNNRVEMYKTPLSGQFVALSPLPIHDAPLVVDVAGMNTDGREDIIVACNSTGPDSSVSIYYQGEDGTVSNADDNAFIGAGSPTRMVSGTFDSGDTAIGTYIKSSNEFLFVTPNGTERGVKQVDSSISDEVAAPLRGGYSDFVVCSRSTDNLTFYWGGTDFFNDSLSDMSFTLNLTGPNSIAVGDISGDSGDDLVVATEAGFQVLYNTGDGDHFDVSHSFTLEIPSSNFTKVATGNLNIFEETEARTDIAVINKTSNVVEIYYQRDSSPPFSVSGRWPLDPQTEGSILWMDVGHFDDDGMEDIVMGMDTGEVLIFKQNINLGFSNTPSTTISLPNGFGAGSIGDVDDDGIDEILVLDSQGREVTVYDGDSSGYEALLNATAGAGVGDVIASDLNQDRRIDFAFSSPFSSSVSTFYQLNLAPVAVAQCLSSDLSEGGEIMFTARNSTDTQSDRDNLQYRWDFGDGNVSYGENVNHTYLDNATYDISLKVTDRGGLYDYSNLTVDIYDLTPNCSFEYSPSQPLEGESIDFTDDSSSYPDPMVAWEWNFGDGNVSYGENVNHTYLDDGVYNVTLTVWDDDGSNDSTQIQVSVADRTPTVSFTISDSNPFEGKQVILTDTSHSFPDEIVSWYWSFGDGVFSNHQNPVHTYIENGTYEVELTVTDDDGSENSTSKEIVVEDTTPTVDFEWSPEPDEREIVEFQDQSSSYDSIVWWNWSFGDGTYSTLQAPSHVYSDNGTYTVQLTVRDDDNSTASKMVNITVHDTTPSVMELTVGDGSAVFQEDQIVELGVWCQPGNEPIQSYQWDFELGPNQGFIADRETGLNRTGFRYSDSGLHELAVRVWDSDSYAQKTLVIEIVNVVPSAKFNYQNITSGEVAFDASFSEDTDNDMPYLEFSWNFDDGGGPTEWSPNWTARHSFFNDGKYNVTLKVRDDDGAVGTYSMMISVDRTAPQVVLLERGTDALVGEPITVSANVTDQFGIKNVTLLYTIGSSTHELTMTPSGDRNIYVAHIPSQNRTGTVSFKISAIDSSDNKYVTGEFEIIVKEPSAELLYYLMALAGLGAFAGILIYARSRSLVVDDVFIIYQDGCLLSHQTRRLKPGMDDDILGSMLVAIQDFVKDSFRDEPETPLKRLDFGDRKVLVEKGSGVYLAVVLQGEGGEEIPRKMRRVLKDIEREYGEVLEDWDGDLERVRGIREMVDPLLKVRAWESVPLLGRFFGGVGESSD